jgi:amino acid permease
MIGAGIVGIPYAYYHLGVVFGFIMNILLCILTCFSCYLYLRIKDLTNGLESFSEIGYHLFGGSSAYWINGLLTLLGIGAIIAYFFIFGEICSGLYK